MNPLASLYRLTLASAVSLVLGSACGGNSYSSRNDGGESGSGGTQNQAGTPGIAGKSSAGGKSAGGAGSGGSPGGEACTAPAVTGTCEAYFERWYHDVVTGLCRPFVYGGCDGNANNYETVEECQKACPGGPLDYDACEAPTDCMLAAASCCGICDGPDLSSRDLLAYNRRHESNRQFQRELISCESTDIACAPCPTPVPGQRSLLYFVPNCVQGQCVVEDIRTSSVTACQEASECRLRAGTQCCEGCGGDDVVSVRNDGSLEELICGDVPQSCPACVAAPPEGVVPACTKGRCAISYVD
jgi:hypothetical protein